MTREKIIEKLKKKDISSEAINAICAIIVLAENISYDDEEHSILTSKKQFRQYESQRFISERFY